MLNKAKVTDAISIALIASSYGVADPYHLPLLTTGLFAFSGAVTNQLAIHMLFERVPGLYGSGVIEKNFITFKHAIHSMIMEQFFTPEKLQAFLQSQERQMDLSPLVASADFTPAFDALKQSVMESKMGAMVQMFGGEDALEPLRESFSRKLKSAVSRIVGSEAFKAQLDHHLAQTTLSHEMLSQIDALIRQRLDELSPKMVKDLVQNLIREHLGWLVVWGGIFGGLMGLLSSWIM